MRPSIDIIVPVLNEAALLPGLLDHLTTIPGWNACIVVDGGSTDESLAIASRHPCPTMVITADGGRHRQLNHACAQSQADVVLIVAADLRLRADGCAAVAATVRAGATHGCLRQYASRRNWVYRWQDAWSRLRCRLSRGAYLDQAPYFRRDRLLAAGGFRPCATYDSADAGERLGGRFGLAGSWAVSSCRAWDRGYWQQTAAYQRQRLKRLWQVATSRG